MQKLFTASVLANDDQRDLALLRTSARACTPLELADLANSAVGSEVYAIGNPLGLLAGTVTRGIISAFRTSEDGIRYIQLDASVNPGNSGGPLVDRDGRVLGVTTFKVEGHEGLNFAVSSTEIRKAFDRFLH
jgi:serine protease Do